MQNSLPIALRVIHGLIPGCGCCFTRHGPAQNVGQEVSIHDIHVDAVRPSLLDCDHLLAQAGKVSRENGRNKLHGMFVHIPSPSWSQFSDR